MKLECEKIISQNFLAADNALDILIVVYLYSDKLKEQCLQYIEDEYISERDISTILGNQAINNIPISQPLITELKQCLFKRRTKSQEKQRQK